KDQERQQWYRKQKINEQAVLDITPIKQLPINNVQELMQYDRQLLGEFCNYIAKLKNSHCLTCNEYFSTINLAGSECQCCYNDK
ncbi:1958_t:CDS:1, partial [Cetraspora pellucida]